MERNPESLTFEQFQALISRELGLPKERVVPDADFIEDLLVDSIRMVEMMLRLEEEGLSIPLEAAWSIETVGDAYREYVKVSQGGAGEGGPAAVPVGSD